MMRYFVLSLIALVCLSSFFSISLAQDDSVPSFDSSPTGEAITNHSIVSTIDNKETPIFLSNPTENETASNATTAQISNNSQPTNEVSALKKVSA